MNRFSEQSKEKRGGSAAHLHVRALPGKMIIDRTVPSDRSEQDRRAASGLNQKARCRFCCRRRLRICHQEIVGCAGRTVRTGRVLRPCRPGKPAKCGQIKEKKPYAIVPSWKAADRPETAQRLPSAQETGAGLSGACNPGTFRIYCNTEIIGPLF